MKQFIALALLVLVASAQVDDWHTCADNIIKAQQDLVDLGYELQGQVESKLIPAVQHIIEECKHGEEDGWATCALSITSFVDDLVQFGQTVQTSIETVIAPDVKLILETCRKDTLPGDWEICMEDVGKVVETAGAVAEDIKKFDIVKLIQDVKTLYTQVQQAIKDCTQGDELEQDYDFFFAEEDDEEDYELEQSNDWKQCMDDINQVVSLTNKIKSDIKKFRIKQLKKDINALINAAQKAIKDCSGL